MEKKIEKYIELAIKIGINLQKGQILVINSPVETADFTRKLVEAAYKNGAGEVVVHWNDELCGKYKYMYGAEELFENYPQWQVESVMEYMRKGAAFLSIYASDPELLKDVEQSKIAKYQRARSRALKEYYDRIMNNYNQWCIVSVPTDAWAKRPKLGFPTPIKQWLKEERFYKQVRELFSESFVSDIFEQDRILKLLDDNYKGDGSHRRQIWVIYTFLVWYKLFFVDYENTVKKYQHVQPEVADLIAQGKLL